MDDLDMNDEDDEPIGIGMKGQYADFANKNPLQFE